MGAKVIQSRFDGNSGQQTTTNKQPRYGSNLLLFTPIMKERLKAATGGGLGSREMERTLANGKKG
ncbi:MAG: hypothetical protein D6800_10335 [Candidatus Zixiibacteriota bacterium]|nr:MAG: hypothetical protein D6800_10335 [candidate division Zixibacteria bacterium]